MQRNPQDDTKGKKREENTWQTVNLAKNGDARAMAVIAADMLPAIRRAAVRVTFPGLELDDAMQEGFIGLYHAVQTYREDTEASFKTYATVCIRNAVNSAGKKARAKKHAPLNFSVQIDEDFPELGPEEIAIQKEQYEALINNIATMLSVMEKDVLSAYIEGKSYSEIALQCGASIKAIDNAVQRIRKKLKKQ
jgi:RNA polymerase sigma factor, sigma-70 family